MARIYNDITETIGNTPLVRLNRTGKRHGALADILVKLELFYPLASANNGIALAFVAAALTPQRHRRD